MRLTDFAGPEPQDLVDMARRENGIRSRLRANSPIRREMRPPILGAIQKNRGSKRDSFLGSRSLRGERDLTAKILHSNMLAPHDFLSSALWKSAKRVRDLTLMHEDKPGFWESLGCHNYGDRGGSSIIGTPELARRNRRCSSRRNGNGTDDYARDSRLAGSHRRPAR